jgi:hypothetical protein
MTAPWDVVNVIDASPLQVVDGHWPEWVRVIAIRVSPIIGCGQAGSGDSTPIISGSVVDLSVDPPSATRTEMIWVDKNQPACIPGICTIESAYRGQRHRPVNT